MYFLVYNVEGGEFWPLSAGGMCYSQDVLGRLLFQFCFLRMNAA